MNILILGHTGFIGSNIRDLLASKAEYNLTTLASNDIDLTKQNSFNLLKEYLLPQDIVIFCSGIKKQLGDNLESFEEDLNKENPTSNLPKI